MDNVLFEFNNYTVKCGKKTLLDNINLKIPESGIFSIIGETGSGKTLLAKSIVGLLPDYMSLQGNITYNDGNKKYDLTNLSYKEKDKLRGRQLLWIPQCSSALNPLLTIRKQLCLPIIRQKNISAKEAENKIKDKFQLLELDIKILNSYPYSLSGGMKVRVMLALGLAMQSRVLILDEPTKGLDSGRCDLLMKLIKHISSEFGVNIILISHDLDIVLEKSSYCAVMYGGKLIDSGLAEEILINKPRNYVKALYKAMPKNGMEVLDFE